MQILLWLDGVTPAPELAAAWLVLDMVPTERVPWWAAEWLAEGRDGPALRELAGLGARDSHEIRELLSAALAEAGAAVPDSPSAAAEIWFSQTACLYEAGQVDERWVACVIDQVVRASDYDSAVYELPLGGLYGVNDEWEGGWGRSEAELRTMIRVGCRDQIRAVRASVEND